MTIAYSNTVVLTDADAVEVSGARAERIMRAVMASLTLHIPGVDPVAAEDAARNIAQAYGVLGLLEAE